MRLQIHRGINTTVRFQSTHPRRVRRNTMSQFNQTKFISIHTPAKGATIHEPGFLQCRRQISIHTPAKGATLYKILDNIITSNFNPHTREGCDSPSLASLESFYISIHTPAKGATCDYRSSSPNLWISIHTPAKGATAV